MFLLAVLLTGIGGLHAGPDPHKTFLQTTVPEKISSSDSKGDPDNNIAYIITIEEKPYFIHLKKQSFLSSVSVVYSYDKDDTQGSKPLLAQMDCNYHGYVAGFPNSLVSLNTCSGLRGTLQIKNISYGIEPVEAISGFVHMIYKEKNDNANIRLLGEDETYSRNSEFQVREGSKRTESFKSFPRYLEMYIVVDKNLFDYMGSDIKAVTQKIIQIIGFVNAMLTQLKMTVVISSIEIWSNKNKISTTGTPNNILSRFLNWKSTHLFQPYHTAYLFAYKKQPSFIGATFPRKICDKNYAAGVVLYPEGLSLESYTVSVVQLLGFNLGLSYDDADGCYCSGDICTMSPDAVYSGGAKDFSTCSLDDFKHFASHSGLKCLHNILPDTPVYKQRRVCGNGVLEAGEQCDCGTLENCTHKSCCDPRTCSLKKGKDCGSGECCTSDCKIKPANIRCRKPFDADCDFPEYCNGITPHCGPDTFARNGQPCDSGQAYCYEGRCRMFNKQCKDLIGGDSKGAPFHCFDEVNTRGDRYGNCGRFFCHFPEKLPRESITTVETPEDRDVTFVEDGTVCGPEMYCINYTCVEIAPRTNYRLCDASTHCNNSGICNNFNHCHCKNGFVPPDCELMKGEFGSIDDGHKIKTAGRSYLEERSSLSKHRFQLIFYIFLPVLIITAVISIKRKKIKELCYRGETESDRSVSEESSSSSKSSPNVSFVTMEIPTLSLTTPEEQIVTQKQNAKDMGNKMKKFWNREGIVSGGTVSKQ
ncbi:disintegrin and metalloproteinase domain-containing protein 5 isoform X3 [Equus caballus]|uniref:disintegrin and metalloproteinase domain-containing protein 5 isoform X3 n=1 Tax=Equus caballus TaxID=9796 RepID=UPI0038B2AA6C